MPRGPRLDMEGALHHVMARGIDRCLIFRTDGDRADLVSRLGAVGRATGTAIYAWSLMPNHFHLLLRSGQAGLSAFMRRVQTGYAVMFNRRHRRTGHLFQNRYKSILVEEESYFLELVRYLHLNPIRAGVVRSLRELDAYGWSGHAALLGKRETPWQDTDYILQQFGSRKAYRQFVADGLSQGRRPELSGGGLIRSMGGQEKLEGVRRGEQWVSDERVLGSGEFVEGALREAARRTEDIRRVLPNGRERFLSRLAIRIARAFGMHQEELRNGSRRREVVAARYAMAYVAILAGVPAATIGRFANVRVQSVLRGRERGKGLLGKHGIVVDRLLKQCS